MNITQENIDDLNAILTVKIVQADYQAKIDTELNTYRKKATIPGFRPGKVPTGVIKKMYGKSALLDSINKLLSESLQKHIEDNKIELLGQPLPLPKANNKNVDWDNQTEFEFTYEMGLAPQFDVKLQPNTKFDYKKIKIDAELVDKYVTDIAKRYGKLSYADTVGTDDIIKCDLVELNDANEIAEGGILKLDATLAIETIKDEAAKASILGLKESSSVNVDIKKMLSNENTIAAVLGITKEEAEKLTATFKLTIKNISHLVPCDVNQELFDKVYGEGNVKSEEEFRSKIKDESLNMFKNDSDRLLYNDIVDHLMTTTNISLPDAFLKRWIVQASEKPTSIEEVETEYDNYAKGMKWQLIENKIIRENNIEVKSEDIIDFTKQMITEQFKQYSPEPISEEQLNQTAQSVLRNREEANKIHTQLLGNKVMELFKTTFSITDKEIPMEEFFKRG
jgi:trigger factor